MSLIQPNIVETSEGLYRPYRIRMEITVLACGMLIWCGLALLRKDAIGHAVFWIFISLAWMTARLLQYKRYGALGPPIVSVAKHTIYLARPNHSAGGVSLALSDLKRIVVYGPQRRRKFRLIKNDSTYIEAVPEWGDRYDQLATQFLLRALPEKVIVEEPQSVFASIRGDGPETLN